MIQVPQMARYHPRMVAAERACVDLLLEHEITHKEGAHVLAEVILNMRVRGDSLYDVLQELNDILGLNPRDELAQGLDTVLDNVWCHLAWTESIYKEDVDKLGIDGEYSLLNKSHQYTAAVPPFVTAPAYRLLIDPLPIRERSTTPIETIPVCETPPPQIEAPFQPFRFLDLPAEMRNRVYDELLAPGDIRHTTSYNRVRGNKFFNTDSDCEPNILATCSQINREAKDILFASNTICLTATVEWMISPIFDKRFLPDFILPNFTSLLLLVDCTNIDPRSNDKGTLESKVHWKQLQHMTGLKKIQICTLDWTAKIRVWGRHVDLRRDILRQIVDRIPEGCEVGFEAREGFEDEYVQDAIDGQGWGGEEPVEVEGGMLEGLFTEGVRGRQGWKSGSVRDYRFAERVLGGGLTELGKGGRFVLGSGE